MIKFIVLIAYVLFVYLLSKNNKSKKQLIINIALTILPLLITKYANSFIIYFSYFMKTEMSEVSFTILGISYLSFKGVSYLVDTYQNKYDQIMPMDFYLYMIFYPALLSGPIEKADHFVKEINKEKEFDEGKILTGMIVFVCGLAIKTIIASRLQPIVRVVLDRSEEYGIVCVLAMILYSIYIYCDFCGYSYMALGSAKMLDIEVINNFKFPYMSLSIKEFWGRWHSSLNIWLRDYIYIPLGGNRKGRIRKYINILLVFVISGIWHGATPGFVLWGIMNAVYQIIGDITSGIRNKAYKTLHLENTLLLKTLKIVNTFILIMITWIFFDRGLFNGLITLKSFLYVPDNLHNLLLEDFHVGTFISLAIAVLFSIVLLVLEIAYLCKPSGFMSKKLSMKYMTLFALLLVVLVFGVHGNGYNASDFIYFDF